MTGLNDTDIANAVNQLARSERGRRAMHTILVMLDEGAIGLDASGQLAVMQLLMAAFTTKPGSVRDAMRAALDV